jgi:diaminohydroxyphosphoribosylaminopyrimidine deaminase/5-amino-6-(5-phosphoribosylamino)uracil reductase
MDEQYMKMALDLAARARGRTSPNPMVGSVIVKNGAVVGRGYHKKAGTPHAEIHALKEAGEAARGATIYVTLEPCCHHGRTGPCTEAILSAGIKRAVVAMTDPNPLVAGKGLDILRKAGVEVVSGLLAEEAAKLNEVFIKYISTGMPFVLLKTAMSLDGKIAAYTGHSRWITGSASRAYVHHLRDSYDAILIGIGTLMADNPSLTARLSCPEDGVKGKDPVRVIVDSLARTPPEAKVLTQISAAPTIIAITAAAPEERVQKLVAAGAQIIIAGNGPKIDLPYLFKSLTAIDITSILIEGGAAVNASVLEQKLADKLLWFIAPKIIGGKEAPGPVGGRGVAAVSEALLLERISVQRFEEDICLEGYLRK